MKWLSSIAITSLFLHLTGKSEGSSSKSQYGLINARSGANNATYCSIMYPDAFPADITQEYKPVADVSSAWESCKAPAPSSLTPGKLVVVLHANCSLDDWITAVQDTGGVGVLVVSPVVLGAPNVTASNFTLGLISNSTRDKMMKLGNKVEAVLTAPSGGKIFEFSLLVLLAMAVFSVVTGAYWSGSYRHRLALARLHPRDSSDSTSSNRPRSHLPTDEEPSTAVNTVGVLLFVVCMCVMLVLLYYFFSYLVYVIIGLFCFASAVAFYQCFEPLVLRLPTNVCRRFKCHVAGVGISSTFAQMVLFAVSFALPVIWAVYRKESFSWILQDILGIIFSINMLRVIRMPSLKICTVILLLLFCYDIFFVFLTPLFTQSGESIMEEVVTGGGASGEQLPMVLRVPHMGSDPLALCHTYNYSLLGFGDILVPGLLLAYCSAYDLSAQTPFRLYLCIGSIGYTLGLILTFVGLYVLQGAQPALLYLVPCTLIPTIIVALCRGELGDMWVGDTKTIKVKTDEPARDSIMSESYPSEKPENTHDNRALI